MWDPGFQPLETVKARLDGYARRFCLRSVRHRGTAEAPGLVLGLDPDDSAHCRGLALAIDHFANTLDLHEFLAEIRKIIAEILTRMMQRLRCL